MIKLDLRSSSRYLGGSIFSLAALRRSGRSARSFLLAG